MIRCDCIGERYVWFADTKTNRVTAGEDKHARTRSGSAEYQRTRIAPHRGGE